MNYDEMIQMQLEEEVKKLRELVDELRADVDALQAVTKTGNYYEWD